MKRRTFLHAAALTTAAAALAPLAHAGSKRPYKVIPCEEVFQVPELLDAQRKVAGGVQSMSTGPIFGPVVPILLDTGEARLRRMDTDSVDMQVLSHVSPGVQNFDAPTAVSLARLANDRLADVVKAHPTRYAGLATFAPQDPPAAAKELDRAVRQLGLKGALVNSHTHGEYLDQPKFLPIFEALESLDVPLYIHPRDPSPDLARGLDMPGFTVGWGYAVETGTHALRLISAGLFDRFPKLRIILGHMGEGIPFFLERIDDRYKFETRMFERKVKLQRLPGEYFRDNFYVTTSGMNLPAPLAATIATLGVGRVLYAIDYPFEDQSRALAALDALPLSEADKRTICETNPRRVFKLQGRVNS